MIDRDLAPKKIVLAATALLLMLSLIAGALVVFQKTVLSSRGSYQSESEPASSPRQQTEFESGELLKKYRETQTEKLNSVKAPDKIPISAAMKIYLKRNGGRP